MGLEAGKRLGKYRILRPIGRGGMGVVYLAEDTMLSRQVALKILDRTLAASAHFEERFRQEARLVGNLQHPNIVQLHALERFGDDLVIDMAYVEGGSLAAAMQSGRIRRNDVLCCVRDVLEALAVCHARGIIHRDVKPSNILLSGDGRALLTDFGLARLLAEHYAASTEMTVSSGFFLGTPLYAPPESWDGTEPTPAWDVYSVGMVLYGALAPRMPYDAQTPYALIKQMIQRPITPLSQVAEGISPELNDAVDSMLAPEAGARPQHAGQALERLMTAAPEFSEDNLRRPSAVVRVAPARIDRGPSRLKRRPSKRTALRGVIAAALALVLAVAGYWAGRSGVLPGALRGGTAPPGATSSEDLPYQIFDTVDPLSQETWPSHWLMIPSKDPDAWTVLAAQGTDLWFLHAAPGETDNLVFAGYWAEYTDESARIFRHGTLQGTGHWRSENKTLSVSLDFRSITDGYRWRRPYLLDMAAAPETDTAFIRRLEENGHIQRIIHHELFPRNLPWAQSLEDRFMAPVAGRIIVPFIGRGEGAIHVDGTLSEDAWRTVTSQDGQTQGTLPGQPGNVEAELLVRHDGQGLYLGLRAEARLANPVVTVCVQPRVDIPMEHSARWSAQIENGALISSEHNRGGRPIPWECTWEASTSSINDRCAGEVFIPFASMEKGGNPEFGDRWRLNCSLTDRDDLDKSPHVYWGFKDATRVEHGGILVFGS